MTDIFKPRVLDLFCGAGGAAMGLAMAGCDVVGVDIKAQPAYPFEFHQDDAMALLLDAYSPAGDFDLIWASPPCQRYARVTRWRGDPDSHPDLLGLTVGRLRNGSTPWIVENVPEAIPEPDGMLCGSMFGLSIKRHRHFLASVPLSPPGPCRHADLFPYMHKGERSYADAMECGWMTNREAREAIPPAYGRWIAGQLIDALGWEVTPPGARWRQCRQCGKAFPCARSDARYCCATCRQRARRLSQVRPSSVTVVRQGRLL
jgi:DNA (cytosine-5)-methyltransferase 1